MKAEPDDRSKRANQESGWPCGWSIKTSERAPDVGLHGGGLARGSAVRGGRRPDAKLGAALPGTQKVFPLDGTLPGSDGSLIGVPNFQILGMD